MKLRPHNGNWPETIAPIGAAVNRATLDGATGDLHLVLIAPAGARSFEIAIPAPWTFTSCLLSVSSDELEAAGAGKQSASNLIGLEGAVLTGIESDPGRLDLVFDSITISLHAA